MLEFNLLTAALLFVAGFIAGVLAMLVFNKLRSGSVSPLKVKREMDQYQEKVEAHFEQTSVKFEQLASQYTDLYQHMAEGATTLCRPENIAIGLAEPADSKDTPQQEPVAETNAHSKSGETPE